MYCVSCWLTCHCMLLCNTRGNEKKNVVVHTQSVYWFSLARIVHQHLHTHTDTRYRIYLHLPHLQLPATVGSIFLSNSTTFYRQLFATNVMGTLKQMTVFATTTRTELYVRDEKEIQTVTTTGANLFADRYRVTFQLTFMCLMLYVCVCQCGANGVNVIGALCHDSGAT